jgi:RNA polymerase sigma factor (sigma-70 family)
MPKPLDLSSREPPISSEEEWLVGAASSSGSSSTSAVDVDPEISRSQAIQALFREHNRVLISFLAARLKSTAEAQDVAQEAYARLLQLDSTNTISFPRAYLFRIAANLAANRLRDRGVHKSHEAKIGFDALLTYPSPEHAIGAQQQIHQVKEALLELPERCRRAFVLHFFAERSVAEVADDMGISRRMARMHIARALEMVRVRLKECTEGGTQ